MMHNLIFGLEILAIGLLIVMSTLLILALILIGFNKLFYKADGTKSVAKKTVPVNNPVNKIVQMGGSSMGSLHQPNPQIAYNENKVVKNVIRPEIIAATMGALLFALEKEKSSCLVVGNKPLKAVMNTWALAGRARLLILRQDFALRRLLRRGRYR